MDNDDLQQLADIKAWEARCQAQAADHPQWYAWTVKRNAYNKAAKKEAVRTKRETATDAERLDYLSGRIQAAESPEDSYLAQEEAQEVRRAILSLTTEERQVIDLMFWQGYTATQVAGILGISKRTVYRLRESALTSMKGLMSVAFGEQDGLR